MVVRDSQLWKLAELFQAFYTLKETAKVLGSGGSNYTSNPCENVIKNPEEVKRINEVVLPAIFEAIYKILIPAQNNKMLDKKYHRHSGFPGGLKTRTLEEMIDKRPTEVIRKAVERMLPKNKLGSQMIGRLKIYIGTDHSHAAQKPERIEL